VAGSQLQAVGDLLVGSCGGLTAIRALLAAGVAFVVAHFVPHAGKLGALLALIVGFVAFVAAAVLTGEIGKADLAQVRTMLGRKTT
jgi:hypothetical protein